MTSRPTPSAPLLAVTWRRLLLMHAALGVALLGLPACGGEALDETPQGIEEPPWTGGEVVPANRHAEDYPSLAARDNADVWVAWQEWNGVQDSIRMQLLTDAEGEGVEVHHSTTHLFGTAMARGADDVLHLAWCEQVEQGGWTIRGMQFAAAEAGELGVASQVERLVPETEGQTLSPRMAADADGRVLLVWQSLGVEGIALHGRLHADGEWGPVVDIGGSARNHWAPDVTSTSPGRFAVVWDAALDGDFDIYLARLTLGAAAELSVETRQRLTDSPRYEAHGAVAAAGERLYVAYEYAEENWGREGSVNKLDEALHFSRRIEVVAVEGEQVAPIAVPFQPGVSEGLKDGCEQPQLEIDGAGNLVMFFRGLTLPNNLHTPEDEDFEKYIELRDGAGVGWRSSIWFTFMTRYDGLSWSIPPQGKHQQALHGSEGRSDSPFALTLLKKGGVAYAVTGDSRRREEVEGEEGDLDPNWWKPMTTDSTLVTVGRLRKGEPPEALAVGAWQALPAWPGEAAGPTRPMVTRTLADGREVQLALGDLHRHTDLSRCSSNWDGPFEDTLRYGYDVGGLQFMAVTDHFEHMTSYDWWRSLAFMDAYDVSGRFANMRAYERADARSGHRNVVSGNAALPVISYRNQWQEGRDDGVASTPARLWAHFTGKDILTIPHTPAGMYERSASVFEWLAFNPEYDRVVEIFQAYRGSSEALDAPRAIPSSHPHHFSRTALDGGLHFGFIASSDHQSTYGAFAGAWVTEVDRHAVFEALHARRSFGSTTPMALWTSWDGVEMGTLRSAPPSATGRLEVEIDTFGLELALVELIVDGVVVDTREPSGSQASLVFEGEALGVPEGGAAYAYVRVRTAEGELGWTSPIRRGVVDEPDGPLGVDAFDEATGKALQSPYKGGARWRGAAAGR